MAAAPRSFLTGDAEDAGGEAEALRLLGRMRALTFALRGGGSGFSTMMTSLSELTTRPDDLPARPEDVPAPCGEGPAKDEGRPPTPRGRSDRRDEAGGAVSRASRSGS